MPRPLRRLLVAMLALALVGAVPVATLGQESGPVLLEPLPPGVSFQLLASADIMPAPTHTDRMLLHRITVDCGQATGEIPGAEGLIWVEHGQVNVHDWATGDVVATLDAGRAYGPADGSLYLASPTGRSAVAWRLSASGAGTIGATPPPIAFETTDCGSGVTRPMAATPATVETVFEADAAAPAGSATLFAGVLLLGPGAAVGQPYASGADVARYAASGPVIVLPVLGGFGNGAVGMGGLIDPELPAGEATALRTGDPAALENFSAAPTVALLFGAVPPGTPIFTAQ